jgi:hypothetical protein
MIHARVVGISFAEQSLCYSLHFSVLLLGSEAIGLVVEGLDEGMKLEQLCHVHLLHILGENGVCWPLRKGMRLFSNYLKVPRYIELFDKLFIAFKQP